MQIIESAKAFLTEPGPVKTTTIALAGLGFNWSHAEVALKAIVLVGTAIVVMNHILTIILRRWCPKRRGVGECAKCRLSKSFFCPRGMGKDDDESI